jgi:uncharacterized Zn-finger protein
MRFGPGENGADGDFSAAATVLHLHIPSQGDYGPAQQKAHSMEHPMAGHSIPHFQNDGGHRTIEIGVKEFMCVGASVPYDHPHVFLDMGDDNEKVCPYCSTLFRYNPRLKATQTDPVGCIFTNQAAA